MIFRWTDENEAELRRLWAEGKSASQVAKAIGAPTRNTVIGKVSRLGLQRGMSRAEVAREGGAARAKQKRGTAKPAAFRPLQFAPPRRPPVPRPIPAFGIGTPFLDLPVDGCRYAVTPDDVETHLFCGAPRAEGKPYCEGHCGVAFRPVMKLTDRDRERRSQQAVKNIARAAGINPLTIGQRHDEYGAVA